MLSGFSGFSGFLAFLAFFGFLPVSKVEAGGLVVAGEAGAERALQVLSGPRRYLVRSWPSDAPEAAVAFTTTAVHLPLHD
jgi:hypothetical protein